MARLLIPSPLLCRLKCLASPSSSSPFAAVVSGRCYISEMRRSAFKENLLRILCTGIAYEAESRPPSTPETSFRSFSVDDRPGEQWVYLRRSYCQEEIKIEATMFDGAAPSSRSAEAEEVLDPNDARLHISLIVEVFLRQRDYRCADEKLSAYGHRSLRVSKLSNSRWKMKSRTLLAGGSEEKESFDFSAL